MTQRRLRSHQAKCLKCDSQTSHKSGYCQPCRTRPCVDCGKITQNQDMHRVHRCSNCTISRKRKSYDP